MANTNESALSTLWAAETLLIRDGLYRADGAAWAAELDSGRPGRLILGAPIDLQAMLESDPDNVTSINYLIAATLDDESGYLFCGDGSWGSEGHFGMLDKVKSIVWVVYLEHANPFVRATVDGTSATFQSSSEISVTVDLTERPYLPPT